MDPLTQGVFGALFAQTSSRPKKIAAATVAGALSGMAPDLDVLIKSSYDPLLSLEYHRHFTHSLFFIPIGGLLCAAVFYALLGRRFELGFWQVLLWCSLGFASHGLVDSLTSYGTQLFWPFSNERIAWDLVSIIDPLVTLPLLLLVVLSVLKKTRRYTVIAIIWISIYLGFSFCQQQRALNVGLDLAKERGIDVLNIEAKPSFANILVWKVITTTDKVYYVDAVKTGWKNEPVIWRGDWINKLSVEEDLPWLDINSQQRKDIERFRWFSNGYIAIDKQNPNRVVDVRYSLLPQNIKPLWGIDLSKTADMDQHVKFYHDRGDSKGASKILWQMLKE